MTEKPRKDEAICYYESNHRFFEVINQNAVLYYALDFVSMLNLLKLYIHFKILLDYISLTI